MTSPTMVIAQVAKDSTMIQKAEKETLNKDKFSNNEAS